MRFSYWDFIVPTVAWAFRLESCDNDVSIYIIGCFFKMSEQTGIRYNSADVIHMLDLLEDIPSDSNGSTSEESSESDNEQDDIEYLPPEIDNIEEQEDEIEEVDMIPPIELTGLTNNNGETSATTAENSKTRSKSTGTKRKSVAKDSKTEIVTAQVEYLESYISESGSSNLTSQQIKHLQTALLELDTRKSKEKLSAQRIRSLVEIAERGWRKVTKDTENTHFDQPQGKQALFTLFGYWFC